ncbi:MAG TPA: class I SAM-dependent methyltransferase [Hanamia sp.]|nr:class I SAM-dependent methyltransferase [Hanamia sp.]
MFEFHADRKRYFDMQVLNAEKYVIPFIEKKFLIKPGMRVLEIGAGEGGVLKAFVNKGCTGVGVELNESRVVNGRLWLKEDIENGKLSFFVNDIYDTDINTLGGEFDIIVLKDVIEHIHDQARLIERLHSFLKPGGVIYFGFPPWQMPFGGHQQMCVHSLSKVPYLHLLPKFIYKNMLKLFKEDEGTVELLLEIKDTGISIERFEKIVEEKKYQTLEKTHYLINPIYEWKFGWKPKVQNSLVTKIPYLRNYITTCVYYLITPV